MILESACIDIESASPPSNKSLAAAIRTMIAVGPSYREKKAGIEFEKCDGKNRK